tara:strand:- start:565 stop:891 length:327 start_codon:yes stop_codon:yes gene_type:complete
MIKQGSVGSICFFYKGTLVTGYPLTKLKTEERYLYHGEDMIRKSKDISIMTQVNIYLRFCDMIRNKKINKEKIRKDDHIYFMFCIAALLRLRVIDNDDLNGYHTFPPK